MKTGRTGKTQRKERKERKKENDSKCRTHAATAAHFDDDDTDGDTDDIMIMR